MLRSSSSSSSSSKWHVRKNNEEIIGFEFIFRIALHKNDLNVLDKGYFRLW
jgi:hypothetical protein